MKSISFSLLRHFQHLSDVATSIQLIHVPNHIISFDNVSHGYVTYIPSSPSCSYVPSCMNLSIYVFNASLLSLIYPKVALELFKFQKSNKKRPRKWERLKKNFLRMSSKVGRNSSRCRGDLTKKLVEKKVLWQKRIDKIGEDKKVVWLIRVDEIVVDKKTVWQSSQSPNSEWHRNLFD